MTQALYAAIRELLPSAQIIELAADEVLVRKGETGDAAFFLEEGAVLVYTETAYGVTPLATSMAETIAPAPGRSQRSVG